MYVRFREGVGEDLMGDILNAEDFVWRDRKRQSGDAGVGLLIRKSIGVSSIEKVSQRWDIIWVRLRIHREDLFIAAVYLSPADYESFMQELEVDIQSFQEK